MANRIDDGGIIPVFRPPKAKKQAYHAPAPAPKQSSSSSSTPKASTSSGGGSSKKPKDPYAAAQAKAEREAQKAKNAAAKRYMDQAASMAGQIKALKHSLGSAGFRAALEQRLANIGLVVGQQDKVLMEGYGKRAGALAGAVRDNEKSEGDSSYQNLTNRARERSNAINEALSQGAGESDVLRSQLMSLRNWDSNQGEINRSYFDTLRSVNSSLTDLNVDTKTARVNMASQANADRDQVYSQYFDQRSETLTQLGNLYGQQGELYGMANEQVASKGTQGKRKGAVAASNQQFMAASKANASVWKNPGVGALMDWQGQGEFKGDAPLNRIEEAPTTAAPKKPEGATLRKWTV